VLGHTDRVHTDKVKKVRQYYRALYRAWGAQHWWPAETRFEVIVGAYLTQNTAWNNVELALANLRSAKVLSVDGIRRVSLAKLEQLLRPSGYFRQKAKRLKTFVAFAGQFVSSGTCTSVSEGPPSSGNVAFGRTGSSKLRLRNY